jgi:exoribonuclease R
MDRDNFLESSVPSDCFDQDILILGSKARNRALPGDLVYVEVFPESAWQSKSGVFLDLDLPLDQLHETVERAEGLLEAEKDTTDKQPTGKIVGIADRHSFRR